MTTENNDMKLDDMKNLYAHGAGVRTLALLVLMIVGWGINIGVTRGQISTATDIAVTAKDHADDNHESLAAIKSDVKIILDDQVELEQDVQQLKRDSMKQTILLERIATKMRVSTETN